MSFQPVFFSYADSTIAEPGLILPHKHLFFAMTDHPYLICAEREVADNSFTLQSGRKLKFQPFTPDDVLVAMCDPMLILGVQQANSKALDVFRMGADEVGGDVVSVGGNAVSAIQSALAFFSLDNDDDNKSSITVEDLVRGSTRPGPMVHGMAVRHYIFLGA